MLLSRTTLIERGTGLIKRAVVEVKKYLSTTQNKSREIDYYKTEISEKLEKLEKNFLEIATSYYLRLQLFDSKSSIEEQEIILEDCEEIIFLEKIKWNDFVIINEEGDILDKLLEEKIKNYSDKDKYMLQDAFNYMLIEEAKERAKEIIKEKESH